MRKSSNKQAKKRILNTLFYMCRLAWKERPVLYLVYFVQLIAGVCDTMVNMIAPKFLIDELVKLASGATFASCQANIIIILAVLIGTNFVTATMQNIAGAWRVNIGEWFNRYLEEQVSEQAMHMDFEYTEDPKALDQMNKAKEGIMWYSGGVTGILDPFYMIVKEATILVGVVTIVIMGCPWLLLIQGVSLLLVTYFNYRINKIDVDSFLKLSALNRRFGYYFYQLANFQYGKDIRLYDSVDMMGDKANVENRKMYNVWKDQSTRTMKNNWGMDIANSLRDGASYFYIGYLAITKAISIGDFSMYASASSNFYWSVWRIVSGVQDVVKRCNYINEYVTYMEYPAAMEKGTEKVQPGEHVIEFRDVSFKYPRTDRYILRHINLKITSGEHLSIVGLNGAGKTTFIKLLCRLYDVSEGEILIDGRNIKIYDDEEYRSLFAVVFQDFQLFAFTLKENVALQNTDTCDIDEVNRALELSGVYDDAVKLEHGLDTIIYKSFDKNGTELSGGQRQKVAISRALYKDAPIVILDEPTAALDPVAEYEIYRKFNDLVGGKTAIYISHRLSSCKFCDHIAVFAEDSIKEYGTHDELVKKIDGVYAEMFAAQAGYYA